MFCWNGGEGGLRIVHCKMINRLIITFHHNLCLDYLKFSDLHLICLQEDPKFKQAQRIRNPKNRLKKMLDACKNKTKCEGGDEIDVQAHDTDGTLRKSRGGCGAQQPKITIDGMKMVAEFKQQKKKNDDQEQLPEPAERRQQLSAEKVAAFI